MSDITIPAAALEAAAISLWELERDALRLRCVRMKGKRQRLEPPTWEMLLPVRRNDFIEQARAACLAMLEAWPDRHTKLFPSGQHHIILPLTEKTHG